MADDDDDEREKHTLKSLFTLYANHILNPVYVDQTVYHSILLSQIDFWFHQAQLLKTTFTQTETGLEYMKFKKWRLSFEDFEDFIEDLCSAKNLDIETIKTQLVAAGVPETVARNNK